MTLLNDEKIIIAIRNRSEGAINETIDKYSKLLWSIIGKVLNNIGSVQDIEECVADTFIYLWENPHKFDPSRGKLKSWLSIIARTKAIDRCREIAKTRTISLESTILVSDLGIVDDMIQEETRRVLIAAVNLIAGELNLASKASAKVNLPNRLIGSATKNNATTHPAKKPIE